MKQQFLLYACILLFMGWCMLLLEPTTLGQTYNTTSLVNTTVNITNAAPIIVNMVLPSTVDLNPYNTTLINCNFTVQDFDNNTAGANATLHFESTLSSDPEDQNTLYTNSSCTQLSPTDLNTNFSCTFNVSYFANNGTWHCNATGIDTLDAANTNRTATGATINPLIAIKMDDLLDFGQLQVGQTSNSSSANVTNAGNRNINISVEGYGSTPGDGNAMDCTFGSIPVGNERYGISNESTYNFMTPLTGSAVQVQQFFVPQRTSEVEDQVNSTWWRLQVPQGAGGVCNGKILFTALDRVG